MSKPLKVDTAIPEAPHEEKPHKHSFLCTVDPVILVVLFLGLIGMASVLSSAVLIFKGFSQSGEKGIDQTMMIAIFGQSAMGAITSLGSLLAGNMIGKRSVQNVKMVNTPEDPGQVQVADEPNIGD